MNEQMNNKNLYIWLFTMPCSVWLTLKTKQLKLAEINPKLFFRSIEFIMHWIVAFERFNQNEIEWKIISPTENGFFFFIFSADGVPILSVLSRMSRQPFEPYFHSVIKKNCPSARVRAQFSMKTKYGMVFFCNLKIQSNPRHLSDYERY